MQAINYIQILSSEKLCMLLNFSDWSSRSTFIIFILNFKSSYFIMKVFYFQTKVKKINILKMEVYLNNI